MANQDLASPLLPPRRQPSDPPHAILTIDDNGASTHDQKRRSSAELSQDSRRRTLGKPLTPPTELHWRRRRRSDLYQRRTFLRRRCVFFLGELQRRWYK
ncbi:uncharacterized protein J3R85_018439 [Psidium guajava]|nr:uncharacterized protein J3R85_018439 [Psidium guajava]